MVSHSVKIEERSLDERIHSSVYECIQATLHLKLRVSGHESALKKHPNCKLYLFAIACINRNPFLFAVVREKPALKQVKPATIVSLSVKSFILDVHVFLKTKLIHLYDIS